MPYGRYRRRRFRRRRPYRRYRRRTRRRYPRRYRRRYRRRPGQRIRGSVIPTAARVTLPYSNTINVTVGQNQIGQAEFALNQFANISPDQNRYPLGFEEYFNFYQEAVVLYTNFGLRISSVIDDESIRDNTDWRILMIVQTREAWNTFPTGPWSVDWLETLPNAKWRRMPMNTDRTSNIKLGYKVSHSKWFKQNVITEQDFSFTQADPNVEDASQRLIARLFIYNVNSIASTQTFSIMVSAKFTTLFRDRKWFSPSEIPPPDPDP